MATGRIEKGQPLAKAISATAWNRAQDAADVVLGVTPERVGEAANHWAGAANIVLVQNGTSAAVKACGILGIDGLAVQPVAGVEMPSIVTRPVLYGVAATEANHANQFVITLEPIAAGKVGRAAASGVVAFRMVDRDQSHKFANIKNGMTDRLQSTECGTLQILARASSGGDGWIWVVGAL